MIPVRTPTDLGALIRDRRRRLGLDQRALAERVGVSRQWIIEAEQGKPGAAVGLVLRTLQALGVTL
ncbi:MAG: helix-turn-helix domain-containing protein, partial [Polyangiaceae bacterium]